MDIKIEIDFVECEETVLFDSPSSKDKNDINGHSDIKGENNELISVQEQHDSELLEEMEKILVKTENFLDIPEYLPITSAIAEYESTPVKMEDNETYYENNLSEIKDELIEKKASSCSDILEQNENRVKNGGWGFSDNSKEVSGINGHSDLKDEKYEFISVQEQHKSEIFEEVEKIIAKVENFVDIPDYLPITSAIAEYESASVKMEDNDTCYENNLSKIEVELTEKEASSSAIQMGVVADVYQQHTQQQSQRNKQSTQTRPYSNAERQRRYREKRKADKMNKRTTFSQSTDVQPQQEQPQNDVETNKRRPQSNAERQRKYRKLLREQRQQQQQMENINGITVLSNTSHTSSIDQLPNVDQAKLARKRYLNRQRQSRFRARQRFELSSTSSHQSEAESVDQARLERIRHLNRQRQIRFRAKQRCESPGKSSHQAQAERYSS
ncbi:uncharacterized protein isoform X3 [Leptinotarsa decemlineata]|uniref:uncharacterized protein isoform X3 n=1 Tax=Leptinotarsa decemlineata TaxID=7539 RepID=UPI003D304702